MILFNLLFGALITFIVAACYIIMIAFTIWMLIDAGKQDRFWWLTVIIGVPVVGAAVYYFTEKKHEYRQAPIHIVHTSETEQQHEKSPKKKGSRKNKKEDIVPKESVSKEVEIAAKMEEDNAPKIEEAIAEAEKQA